MTPSEFVNWGLAIAFVAALQVAVILIAGFFLRGLIERWKE